LAGTVRHWLHALNERRLFEDLGFASTRECHPADQFQARILTPRLVALGMAALVAACRSDDPPGYMRVSGPAPVVVEVPASGAALVVFWASWCAPCVEEAPGLAKLASDSPDGLRVVLFSHDESLAPAQASFAGARALELHEDPARSVSGAFGVERLPASFLVVNSRLVARFDGPRDWASAGMRRLLERLLDEPVRD
jgi:cytochrome c biogenesis protein CcmG/thiol:disulfide interchange protein DsbE